MDRRILFWTLGILLVFGLLSASVFLLPPVDNRPRVSGAECPTVDTDAPINPTSEACWLRFANVGVFICPTQAHPDWLTALPPYCPP